MLIDGRICAKYVLENLRKQINGKKIRLDIIWVGDNPASKVYTAIKQKKAKEIGMEAHLHQLPKTITTGELKTKIEKLNKLSQGIIVQLPLPNHLDKNIINHINPAKDVDGLTIVSQGKNVEGDETLAPATPKGVVRLLEFNNIPLVGMNVVIINRSSLVGKPLAMMLTRRDATVTICHSKTIKLPEICSRADILITGIGKPHFITKDYVKPGAVVIDVGTTKVGDKLSGDVDFEAVKNIASAITPVPGGVGPMTVAMLLENVWNSYNFLR